MNFGLEMKILLIEDDQAIAKVLEETGRSIGASVETCPDGESGLVRAEGGEFALAVVDVSLPGIDGFQVCRKIRESNKILPILMVTSRAEEIDKVLGLELGADDYVTKPFSVRELAARMKVLVRRFEQIQEAKKNAPQPGPAVLSFGPLEIRLKRREAYFDNKRLELTALEFEILAFLAMRAGEATSRDELMRGVWGYECSQFDSTVTTHLSRLRHKLEPRPELPRFIITVKGVGYRFTTPDELSD